jgi:dTDP-4-dehydrorhamnose 3,5-epimerase
MFKNGIIDGVEVRALNRYSDERGWLMEVFRDDELVKDCLPAMTYVSMTRRVWQRPHEHTDQVDYFCFSGPSTFRSTSGIIDPSPRPTGSR